MKLTENFCRELPNEGLGSYRAIPMTIFLVIEGYDPHPGLLEVNSGDLPTSHICSH